MHQRPKSRHAVTESEPVPEHVRTRDLVHGGSSWVSVDDTGKTLTVASQPLRIYRKCNGKESASQQMPFLTVLQHIALGPAVHTPCLRSITEINQEGCLCPQALIRDERFVEYRHTTARQTTGLPNMVFRVVMPNKVLSFSPRSAPILHEAQRATH